MNKYLICGFIRNCALLCLSIGPIASATYASNCQVFYSASTFTLTQGVAVPAKTLFPLPQGCANAIVTGCSISPALPSGLKLSTSSCEITGTPTNVSVSTKYTVTPTDAKGVGIASSVSIAVAPGIAPAPPQISFTTGSYSLVQGAAVKPGQIQPKNTGGSINTCTITPPLPAGLLLDNTSCSITGTASVASAQGVYNVLASNGLGSSSASVILSIVAVDGNQFSNDLLNSVKAGLADFPHKGFSLCAAMTDNSFFWLTSSSSTITRLSVTFHGQYWDLGGYYTADVGSWGFQSNLKIDCYDLLAAYYNILTHFAQPMPPTMAMTALLKTIPGTPIGTMSDSSYCSKIGLAMQGSGGVSITGLPGLISGGYSSPTFCVFADGSMLDTYDMRAVASQIPLYGSDYHSFAYQQVLGFFGAAFAGKF